MAQTAQQQHTVDARFIQQIGDRDFVKVEGLLDLAPAEDNNWMVIIRACVTTERGTFSGIGDATPKNVNGRIAPHIVRMAETRAVARALRLACNIGMCSVEELGGDVEERRNGRDHR